MGKLDSFIFIFKYGSNDRSFMARFEKRLDFDYYSSLYSINFFGSLGFARQRFYFNEYCSPDYSNFNFFRNKIIYF